MSTILKALRRLEEDKVVSSGERPLREEVAAAGPGRPPHRRPWVPVLVGLMGLGAGVTAFWLFVYEPGAVSSVAAESQAGEVRPAAAAAPPTATPRDADGPPRQAFASKVAVVPRPDAKPRVKDADPIRPARPTKPGARRPIESSSAVARARAEASRRRARAELARAKATAPVPKPALAPPAPAVEPAPPKVESAAKPPAPAPERPPVVESLPVEPTPTEVVTATAAAAAPVEASEPAADETTAGEPRVDAPAAPPVEIDVVVQRTQWHPLPDRRSAWLVVEGEADPQRVVEGDVVSGILVSEIEPSGVVFERDGETLRRSLGVR